jgi:peptide/nickel transport system substrate-binding protein
MGAIAGQSVGGWTTLTELHSAGLITSDVDSPRPTGRLAQNVPSLDDGTISMLPDGRMRAIYRLRHDVTWQDGAPFTAQDLAFSQTLLADKGLPITLRDGAQRIDRVQAIDDFTAAFDFRQPYYLANQLGLRTFWPQPYHLLGDAYERYRATGNADEVVNLPYWTSDYVHLGAFQVSAFDPGEGITLQAYGGFFLGKPKIDTISVRVFRDEATLLASLFAGAVDLFPDPALQGQLASDLRQRWAADGGGTVFSRAGPTYFLSPQWRPGVQREPANLDVRVRQALYQAIDREGLSELVEPAWSLIPPGDPLYEATQDGLRRYPYDPARSRALLQEAGWTAGPDGALVNGSDGRRFHNTLSTVDSGRLWEVAAYADFWRRTGLEVDEVQTPAAQARDLEFRANYPSWEVTSAGEGDAILHRLEGPAASAENRWSGNRGGYAEPATQQLLARYYGSLTDRDQAQAMRDLSERVATELPILITYYDTHYLGVRSAVRALGDIAGGQDASRPYGTYSRNAYLWDLG